LDLVVILRESDGDRLAAAFPVAGFYTPPAEVIALETRREGRGHFYVFTPSPA
jgi:hypothetical protein